MLGGTLWWLLIATALGNPEISSHDAEIQERGALHIGLQQVAHFFDRRTKTRDSEKSNGTSTTHKPDKEGHAGPTTILSAFVTTGTCEGTSTYYGGTPSTVYATVTEGFNVTVAGSDTFTAQETLYTPPAACTFTIFTSITSTASKNNPMTTFPSPTPPYTNLTGSNNSSTGFSHGQPVPEASSTSEQRTFGSNSASNGFTPTIEGNVVTVTVTKKTPVRVTPPTTTPAVQFPTDVPDNSPTLDAPPPNGTPQGTPGNPKPTDQPTQQAPPPPNTDRPTNKPGGRPNPPDNNTPGNRPTGTGLGSLINSIINSPFVPASTTFGTAAPSDTMLHGVPVHVGPSTAWIGGHTVPLPSASHQSTVVVNDATFTVRPTEIVVDSSTLSFGRQHSITEAPQSLTVVTLPKSTITRNGIVVTIGPSKAILSGTTYRIGPNAPATTVVVSGHKGFDGGKKQTITFDSNGVAFPSITYNPALTVANVYVVTTIGAHITVSIDMSEAILSGSSYSIGSGASTASTSVDGTTVIFGPNGVVVPGVTTIAPTSVEVTATQTDTGSVTDTAAAAAGNSASASQTAASANAAVIQRGERFFGFESVGLVVLMLYFGILD